MSDVTIDSIRRGFLVFKSLNRIVFNSNFSSGKEVNETVEAWSMHLGIRNMDAKTFSEKMAACACNAKFFPNIDEVIAANEFKEPSKNEIKSAFNAVTSNPDYPENKIYRNIMRKANILQFETDRGYNMDTNLSLFATAYKNHFKEEHELNRSISIFDNSNKLEAR